MQLMQKKPFKKIDYMLTFVNYMNSKTSNNQCTLQQIMQSHRVSVRGLAALSGLSPSMISRLINKKRKFLLRHKIKIAKIFNKKVDNIIWP